MAVDDSRANRMEARRAVLAQGGEEGESNAELIDGLLRPAAAMSGASFSKSIQVAIVIPSLRAYAECVVKDHFSLFLRLCQVRDLWRWSRFEMVEQRWKEQVIPSVGSGRF